MVERPGGRPLTSSAWGTGGSPAGDETCRRVQLIRRAASSGASNPLSSAGQWSPARNIFHPACRA